ncbi:MAG: energy transducer TonB [Myxococcales bacterium]|nr:energy transducer TonB [Myxococcales bacterium]
MARHLTAAFLAIGVTFSLFYLMQALILGKDTKLGESSGTMIDFVRLKKDSELETKKRKMPDKKEPEEPPPPPALVPAKSNRPNQDLGEMVFAIDVGVDVGGANIAIAASDSDVIPIVRVQPQYPLRAAERGTEGWVEVEFTISKLGTVKDAVVMNSYPSSVFDRVALKAIRRWKYNPKIEDGEPVERPGVKVRLRFDLSNQ